MGFDGNGNYVRTHNWTQDAANNINISSTEMDQEDNSIAGALNIAVTRDGQGKMAADFLPITANLYNLGTSLLPWNTLNGIPITQLARYPQTSNEVTAGVTPANYSFPPGDVRRYGADSSGAADSTAAIQAAIASNKAVFIPSGNFKFSALVMPTTAGFVFYGTGTSSVLTQTGTGITWPSTGTNPCGYYEGYIRDLAFVSTAGTGHVINTQYAGGVTLMNLYFGNLPVGFDGIHVDGNAASTGDKYTHDVRIINMQVYSNTAGHSGIGYGPNASDTSFTDVIMNLNFATPYCIYLANGAQSVNGSNSHPYNSSSNIVFTQAGATTFNGLTFSNVIFDNSSGGDNVVLNNCSTPTFTACWWEVTNAGKNSLTLNNTRGCCVTGCRFDSPGGSLYAVNETGTTDYTQIISGDCPVIANFSNPPVNLIGPHSTVKNFVAYNPLGIQEYMNGETTAAVAAGSTVYLGPNGATASEVNANFIVPVVGGMNAVRCDLAFTTAPGAGQTYTITLRHNGAVMTAAAGSANPAVVTGTGVFNASIIVQQGAAAFLSQFDSIDIQLVTSAGAASANFRYATLCTG